LLLKVVECIAKENINVLPVVSKEDAKIIGILSYCDFIVVFRYGISELEKK
jgi:CBS domain-containing protein